MTIAATHRSKTSSAPISFQTSSERSPIDPDDDVVFTDSPGPRKCRFIVSPESESFQHDSCRNTLINSSSIFHVNERSANDNIVDLQSVHNSNSQSHQLAHKSTQHLPSVLNPPSQSQQLAHKPTQIILQEYCNLNPDNIVGVEDCGTETVIVVSKQFETRSSLHTVQTLSRSNVMSIKQVSRNWDVHKQLKQHKENLVKLLHTSSKYDKYLTWTNLKTLHEALETDNATVASNMTKCTSKRTREQFRQGIGTLFLITHDHVTFVLIRYKRSSGH
jgi:hypothetical protein